MLTKRLGCLMFCAVLLVFSGCGKESGSQVLSQEEAENESPQAIETESSQQVQPQSEAESKDSQEDEKEMDMENLYGTGIPAYRTESGQVYPQASVGDDGYLIYVSGTTMEECDAYADLLSQQGLELYSKRELPAGSRAEQNNTFYTYTAEKFHVFLSWYPAREEVRIVMTPPGDLPSLEVPQLTDTDITAESLTQTGLKGEGMQYIIQVSDGGFVIMDGGAMNSKDMHTLYDYLFEKTPEGQKPVVHLWMLSHAHQDHVGLATAFIKKYADDIEVEAFAYNFPDLDQMYTKGMENDKVIAAYADRVLDMIDEFYPDAKRYLLHAGQIYYYKGLEIEITQTEEEIYPETARTWNYTCASWRAKFPNGQQVMFLTDTSHERNQRLAEVYGDYLKSDALQVAHHGLAGGNLELYQYIDPAICLWPTDIQRFTGTWPKYSEQYCLGEAGCDFNAWIRDDSIRKREHFCHEFTVTLFMDEQGGIRCETDEKQDTE